MILHVKAKIYEILRWKKSKPRWHLYGINPSEIPNKKPNKDILLFQTL